MIQDYDDELQVGVTLISEDWQWYAKIVYRREDVLGYEMLSEGHPNIPKGSINEVSIKRMTWRPWYQPIDI